MRDTVTLHNADCLAILPTLADESIQCIITSPPYNLRGTGGTKTWQPGFNGRGNQRKLGQDYTGFVDNIPDDQYMAQQQAVIRQCWRLLANTGVMFYVHKNLHRNNRLLSPWRLFPADVPIRDEIVWDRDGSPTWNSAFFLPMTERIYVFAKPAWKVPQECISWGDVWHIRPERRDTAAECAFPSELVRRCIIAGSNPGDTILDPYMGVGTVGATARIMARKFIGIEIVPEKIEIARQRLTTGSQSVNPAHPVLTEQPTAAELDALLAEATAGVSEQ